MLSVWQDEREQHAHLMESGDGQVFVSGRDEDLNDDAGSDSEPGS